MVKWELDKWWKKLVYIIGWVWISLFIIGFIVGFVTTLIGEI